jgi:type I restriction enzyme S subunit
MDTGSAIPSTSREDFYRLDVRVPPLSIQRRIAEILEAFDDKIELNRRMNETLEEMAQVLYRYWFVDFGPFQDREFKDTEALGPIPKRWEVGSLEDIVENVRGTVEPDNYPDSLPYIGLGDMPKGSIHLNEWQRAEEAGSKKRHFEEGHFLFGKLRPYFKKVGIAPVEGICSTDMLVLEPANEHTRSMALGQLIQDDFIDFTDQASTGTSHPRISWKRMRGYSLALPPVEVAREFEQLVDPWLELVTANIRENKSLSKTRDYLLSKLISGEIEVATAEQQAEEVAEVGDVSTA